MTSDRVYNVGVLVGSLRKASFSRRLAVALQDLAPPSMQFHMIDIGGLSFYNQDEETATPPASWVAFRKAVRESDALLFVTPEYNRSIPGVLKNAIDVGSRPKGQAAFAGKPSAVISNSPGVIGGFGANHALRQNLMCMDVPVMAGPEAYIGGIEKVLGESGGIANDTSREFLKQFMQRFATWAERF